jgi:hypothetical protein
VSQLQRQVQISFSTLAGSVPLAIEQDPGVYNDALTHLLLFPDVFASVRATVGEVHLGNSKVIDVPGGVLQVSNSDTASLPVPPSSGFAPTFETIFSMNSDAEDVDAAAYYDSASFLVRLSRRCTAAISYSPYKASARMLTYTPKVESSPAGGAKTTYGVIVARYQGAMIIYPVTPPSFENGEDKIELYAITSHSISTRDGEFEFPPGFPAVLDYTNPPAATPDFDQSIVAKNERIHEVGYINARGYCWVEQRNVVIREPYVGNNNYTPVKSKRVNTLDPKKYTSDIIAKAADFIASRGLGRV